MQELARRGRARPAVPYSGSPATGCPIASRCARIWCVRPVSSRTRSSVAPGTPRSISKCVTAGARLVGVGGHPRAHAAVAARAARRSSRAAPAGRPSTSARYSRVISRSAAAPCSAACTASLRATTSRPEVSRSSRCTTPARSGSSPPATRPASACTSVPGRWPARGVDDDAGGLVDDQQVLVLVGDRERRVRAPRARRPAGAGSHGHALARRDARGASAARRRRRARARRRSAAAPRRASRRRRRGRRRAARPPRPARPQLARRGGPSSTYSSAITPNVIAMSATLNAGQCGKLDEVGHRAVAHAVDQVAGRAAEQQPGRQPHQRAVGWRDEEDQQRARARRRDEDHQRVPPPANAPNATPVLRTLTSWMPGSSSTARRGPIVAAHDRLGHLVDHDHRDRHQRGAQPCRHGLTGAMRSTMSRPPMLQRPGSRRSG